MTGVARKNITVELYLFILSYQELRVKFKKILRTFYICRITIFLVASCE